MIREHDVVIIPGLGDEAGRVSFLTRNWHREGLKPHVHKFGWKEDTTFEDNLGVILSVVDSLLKRGKTVSLIGLSAGGSAVLNLFAERKDKIHRAINVCGRLTVGTQKGFRSFEARTASSPIFADSVKRFQTVERQLSDSDRQRIMTIRALFGDELVPSDTATVDGAVNIVVPTTEHLLSIAAALSIFSKPLIDFIKQE